MQYFLHFLNGLIYISGILEIFLIALLLYDILIRPSLGMGIIFVGVFTGIASTLTFSFSMLSFAMSLNAEPREILIPTIGLCLGIPSFIITLIYIYVIELDFVFGIDSKIGPLLSILNLIGLGILGILGIMTIGVTLTCILMGIFGLIVFSWLLFRNSPFYGEASSLEE